MNSLLHKTGPAAVAVATLLIFAAALGAVVISAGCSEKAGIEGGGAASSGAGRPSDASTDSPADTAATDAGPVVVTTASFDRQVLQAEVPVLVDFYADWCGPCAAQAPILAEFARSTPGVRVVKVDVDRSPELATRYSVRNIPTLTVFRNGRATARHVGIADREHIKALLGI